MPRSYGRTSTSIWRDKDFRELSPEGRFVYTMLFNQPNISAVGVLELTTTRWSGNTGYPIETVLFALDELVKREYIVIDNDAEELLVRSFVKWDGGSNNELRRKAIRDAADAVASDLLRASIAQELDRISIPHGLQIPPASPIDTRRVVVKEGDQQSNPQPATRNPDPESATREGEAPSEAASDDAPPPMYCSKHPNGTEQACGPCAGTRKAYAAWAQAKTDGEIAARRARAQAIAACELCDEHGKRLDPKTRLPVGTCNHQEAS